MANIRISTFAKHFGLTRQAIHLNVRRGNIPARYEDGIWLIDERQLNRFEVVEHGQHRWLQKKPK